MISALGNLGDFGCVQDQFLGDLTHLVDDLIQRTLIGNGLPHFLGFPRRQPEADGFSTDFSRPSPSPWRLGHNAALA